MNKTIKHLLLACVTVLAVLPSLAVASEKPDTAFQKLYDRYLELYGSTGRDAEFYSASKAMSAYYQQHGERENFYKIRLNETLYDTEHNHPYLAIKKANQMLDDMEAENLNRYDLVYTALGTVFESRGNAKMAGHYYSEALKYKENMDEGSLIGLYSRLAYLHMLRRPLEAKRWNDKYYELSLKYPDYHQVNLFIAGMIDFALGYENDFRNIYKKYYAFREKNEHLDSYGREVLEVVKLAFDHQYQDALVLLDKGSTDINDITRYDMRMKIYELMGNPARALEVARQRSDAVDSLNSDMLFDNLNEINAQTGIARMQAQVAKSRNNMLIVVIVLGALTFLGLVIWTFSRMRMRRNLVETNEQLNKALRMAEESDNMKTEFVRNVSHEIRTPLNAINGFTEIVVNPDIELGEEERADLVARIKENTVAITKIVDELLNLSEKAGGNQYPRTGDIYCNQFFSKILYSYRDAAPSSVELHYTSDVINRFTIKTNPEGVRQIMDHLIQNSIKFTSKGSINVHCRPSANKRMVEIVVTDTGKGIAEEKRSRIFEEFFKEDSFKQGIGLGLAVSKKIAQKMMGDLTLDESYTTGARFVLRLPAEG